MSNPNSVLVFGAHADDETIGCGGTIALLARKGYSVAVTTFCWSETGEWSDTGYSRVQLKDRISRIRRDEALAADRILGVNRRMGLGLPTQGVDDRRETYQELVRLIRSLKPKLILTHNASDKHRDHRMVSKLTEEARWKASERVLADAGEPWYTPALYFYEVTELFEHPSHVVDVSETFSLKMRALAEYASQADPLSGLSRYVESVGRARGYLSGSEFAEAFIDSHLLPYLGLPPAV